MERGGDEEEKIQEADGQRKTSQKEKQEMAQDGGMQPSRMLLEKEEGNKQPGVIMTRRESVLAFVFLCCFVAVEGCGAVVH